MAVRVCGRGICLVRRQPAHCLLSGPASARSSSTVSVAIRPPNKSAPREAPTAVAAFTGVSPPGAVIWEAIETACLQNGFPVARVQSRASQDAHNVDNLVEDMRTSFLKAGFSLPPIAITTSYTAVLVQKYLESYPVSALIALGPLPPQPAATCARWAHTPGGKGSLANSLRVLSDKDDSSVEEQAHLLSLLCAPGGGVNLEPQPVPMLVIIPDRAGLQGAGAWLNEQDVQATLDFHGLDEEEKECIMRVEAQSRIHDSNGNGHELDPVLAALWGVPPRSPAEAAVHQQVAQAVATRVAAWVQARF